ncbi:choice-of-anchor Q domain-containing protein, partial [Larkinella harenae]
MLASAQIRYVRANGTNTNPATATSWANATSNLQGAINSLSATGGQVWVAAGTYKPTQNANVTISFALKNGVAVYGGFVGTEIRLTQRPPVNPINGQPSGSILSGDIGNLGYAQDNSYHVIFNDSGINGTAVLDGFVITGGNAYQLANQHSNGGGMYNNGSSPTVVNCTFQSNAAITSGGGMYNTNNSNPTLTNCNFLNNEGNSSGGGIYNETNSNPILTNCNFLNNSTSFNGGGVFNRDSNPSLTNCNFESNSANTGGGIYNSTSNSTLINCSFLNNTALSYGGGIYIENSNLSLANCSFQGNSARYGGGLAKAGGNTTLTNCVLFGNGGDNTLIGNITLNNCLVEASTRGFTDGGNNQTTTNTPFASTSSTQLNSCSPAINAGTNSATGLSGVTTDLAGKPRIVGGTVDMGAYEYQANPTVVTITNPTLSTTRVGQAFNQRFTAAGGSGSFSFSVVSGTLPAGLSLATNGVLSGTPTQFGSFSLTVQARLADGCVSQSSVYNLLVTAGSILYVKPGGSGLGNGSSWAHASPDLQAMINAPGVEQVWVAAGTYKPTNNSDRTISFGLKNGVAVYGGFVGTESRLTQRPAVNPGNGSSSVLSGAIGSTNSYHVVYNGSGINRTAVLDGFVITNGKAESFYSHYRYGGGMYNSGSSPTVVNCSFQQNTAIESGGGLYNENNSNPILINCNFLSNEAASSGGGIYNTDSPPTLISCSFQGNTSFNGGALYNRNSSPALTNCSFQGNIASSAGGAIFGNSMSTLTNCVLFGNGGDNTLIGNITLNNCLVEASTRGFTDGGNNQTTTNTPFASTSSTQLNSCSPAINAGTNSATGLSGVTTDLAGKPRIVGGTVDMGAYEYQANPTVVTITNPTLSTTRVGQAFNQRFTAAGGSGSFSFSVVSGTLPAGLSLATNGVLSGTPTQFGSFSLTVQARLADGCVSQSSVYNLLVTAGSILYVKPGGSGLGNGSSWAHASPDLQAMINAPGVEQVWVAAGTYTPENANISFGLKNGVAIYGGFTGIESNLAQRPVVNPGSGQASSSILSGAISGSKCDHVIFNLGIDNTAVLDGFIISDGRADSFFNSNQYGGGMYNSGSSPTVVNCSFQGNTATGGGGGLYNESNSNPTLINCSFLNNSGESQLGGGIYNKDSSPRLINCSFQGNTAFSGGALYNNNNSSTSLINCGFQSNSSTSLGGAIVSYSNMTLTNCSFQDNANTTSDEEIFIGSGNTTLINCVLYGIGFNNIRRTLESSVTLRNCLVKDSEIGFTDGGNNRKTTINPFVSTSSIQLNSCSPAINGGTNSAAELSSITTDLAGNPRIVGGTVDIGAYEYQGTTNVVTISPVSQTITAGQGVTISASGSDTYTWSTGQTGDRISVSPTTTTVYSVTGTSNGCSTVATMTVTVLPTASLVNNASGTCVGIASLSVNNSSLIQKVEWYNGSRLVFTSQAQNITTGTTVAGNGEPGLGAAQVNNPSAVFVDGAGAIYVTDKNNARVMKWAPGATTGVVVAGGNGAGSTFSQLNQPHGIWVDESGAVYVADFSNNRVMKWAVGASLGQLVAGGNNAGAANHQLNGPASVWGDGSGAIYVADASNHRIMKWSAGATTGTLVAGGYGQGSSTYQLNFPTGVFVDGSGATYIADRNNHRIMKWPVGQSLGQVVAGGNGPGSGTHQLNSPQGVYVDGSGAVYAVDQNNNRIQKWTNGASSGKTVAGNSQAGSASDQLNFPYSVSVDGAGAVYVADHNNNRVQKWASGELSSQYSPTEAGSYRAKVTDVDGFTVTTNAIDVVASPTAFITPSSTTLSCARPTVTLTASPTSDATYAFSNGARQIDGGNTATVATAGTYSVTVTTGSGCQAVASVTITGDNQVPVATITPANAQLTCAQPSVELTATGGSTYRWDNGATSPKRT